MTWMKMSPTLWVANDDNKEVGTIWKDKLSYTAHYLKDTIMVKDFFISFKSAKTWADMKLKEQGYVELD